MKLKDLKEDEKKLNNSTLVQYLRKTIITEETFYIFKNKIKNLNKDDFIIIDSFKAYKEPDYGIKFDLKSDIDKIYLALDTELERRRNDINSMVDNSNIF